MCLLMRLTLGYILLVFFSVARASDFRVEVSDNVVELHNQFWGGSVYNLDFPEEYERLTKALLNRDLSQLTPHSSQLSETIFQLEEVSFFSLGKELLAETFLLRIEQPHIFEDCPEHQKLEIFEEVCKLTDEQEVRDRAASILLPGEYEIFEFLLKLDEKAFERAAAYVAGKAKDSQALIDFVFATIDRPDWIRPHATVLQEADVVQSQQYLIKAVQKGFTGLARFLIEELRFNATFDVDEKRQTLLHVISPNSDVRLIELLLKSVANIKAHDVDGNTFLMTWLKAKYPTHFFNALFESPSVSQKDMKYLVNRQDQFELAPLAYALMKKRYEVMILLLRAGAKVDISVPVRRPKTAIALKMQKIAPFITGAYSQIARPPLEYAVFKKDPLATRILLNEYPGAFDQLNAHGETAIIVAARFGTPYLVRMLLESGKVPLDIIKPAEKKNAKDFAQNNIEIANVFEQFESK